MLHKLLEPGDWFAAKRFGYGAGLPIVWQGWALLLSYAAAMIGGMRALDRLHGAPKMAAIGGLVLLTALFLRIAARRTRGGGRWRNGGRNGT